MTSTLLAKLETWAADNGQTIEQASELWADYARKCSLFDQSAIFDEFAEWNNAHAGYDVRVTLGTDVETGFWYRSWLDARIWADTVNREGGGAAGVSVCDNSQPLNYSINGVLVEVVK